MKQARLALTAFVAAALMLAAPVRADIVTVHGTASSGVGADTLLAKIGFTLDPAGSFEFSYSYNSAHAVSTGFFKLVHRNAAGTTIDTIDLDPTAVGFSVTDDFDHGGGDVFDEYYAASESTRNGTGFIVGVDLIDRTRQMLFPPYDPAFYLNNPWPEAYLGIGVSDALCGGAYCTSMLANITSISAVITRDADGDGVPDANDKCTGSSGAVNADGCTIDQLVPCTGPAGGGTWRNHGAYVAEVARVAQLFVAAGLITSAEKDAIMAAAGAGGCGR